MNKVDVLQKCRLFDNLLPDELGMLAELCVSREYAPGDKVFEKDDVGDALYILVSGAVDVVIPEKKGADKVLATLAAPEFFGEMSLIDKEYRSATVRARETSAMLVLSNENLFSFSKVHREGFTWVVVNIARVLSGRLRDTNRRLAEKL